MTGKQRKANFDKRCTEAGLERFELRVTAEEKVKLINYFNKLKKARNPKR